MIPDDVLDRATDAFEVYWWTPEPRRTFREGIEAALPILIPAIRADLIREMMEQTHSWIIIKDDEQGDLMDSWLVGFLPATEEAQR